MLETEKLYGKAIEELKKEDEEKEIYTVTCEDLKEFAKISDKQSVERFNEDYQLLIPTPYMTNFDDTAAPAEESKPEEASETAAEEQKEDGDTSGEEKSE